MHDQFDEQAKQIARPLRDVSDVRHVLAAILRRADLNARDLLVPAAKAIEHDRTHDAAPLPAEVTPRDDLRERAIRVVAEIDEHPIERVRSTSEWPNSATGRAVAAVERALREEYQRGQAANRPAGAIALNADQLRDLARSDEHGDAPIVTTVGELRAAVKP